MLEPCISSLLTHSLLDFLTTVWHPICHFLASSVPISWLFNGACFTKLWPLVSNPAIHLHMHEFPLKAAWFVEPKKMVYLNKNVRKVWDPWDVLVEARTATFNFQPFFFLVININSVAFVLKVKPISTQSCCLYAESYCGVYLKKGIKSFSFGKKDWRGKMVTHMKVAPIVVEYWQLNVKKKGFSSNVNWWENV